MSGLTLQDILSSEIDDIISKIVVKTVDKSVVSTLKKRLEGYFKHKSDLLVLHNTFNIDGHKVAISQFHISKSRVEFNVIGTPYKFTLTKRSLLGIENKIPFEVGDSVIYKDEICSVLKVIPNDNKLIIQTDVYQKEVNVRFVRKFEE